VRLQKTSIYSKISTLAFSPGFKSATAHKFFVFKVLKVFHLEKLPAITFEAHRTYLSFPFEQLSVGKATLPATPVGMDDQPW